MLAYIYRLIRDYEHEHGTYPNLLYLNNDHATHLKASFNEHFSMQDIADVLQMELILDPGVMHPHAAWVMSAQKKLAS